MILQGLQVIIRLGMCRTGCEVKARFSHDKRPYWTDRSASVAAVDPAGFRVCAPLLEGSEPVPETVPEFEGPFYGAPCFFPDQRSGPQVGPQVCWSNSLPGPVIGRDAVQRRAMCQANA